MNSGFCKQSQCSYVDTVIFICRGRNAGIPNVETDRDIKVQTRTDRDSQGQTGTDKDKQGQTGTNRDRNGQTGTDRDRQGISLLFPVSPCLVPVFSLIVPDCRMSHDM